jgi:hypothetical protein
MWGRGNEGRAGEPFSPKTLAPGRAQPCPLSPAAAAEGNTGVSELIDAIFALSPDICYVALARDGELTMRERLGDPGGGRARIGPL